MYDALGAHQGQIILLGHRYKGGDPMSIHKHEWGPFLKAVNRPIWQANDRFAKCRSCGRQRHRTETYSQMTYKYHMVPKGEEVVLPW